MRARVGCRATTSRRHRATPWPPSVMMSTSPRLCVRSTVLRPSTIESPMRLTVSLLPRLSSSHFISSYSHCVCRDARACRFASHGLEVDVEPYIVDGKMQLAHVELLL